MRLPLLILLFLVPWQVKAQHYTRDAGMRGGLFPGICYRQYSSDTKYSEVMLSLGKNAIRVNFLKEFVMPAFPGFSPNLHFIYGFGAHSGFSSSDHFRVLNRTYFYNNTRFSPVFGVDGYLCLEYCFHKVPFLIGIDLKPFFEYSTNQYFNLSLHDTALNLKFKF